MHEELWTKRSPCCCRFRPNEKFPCRCDAQRSFICFPSAPLYDLECAHRVEAGFKILSSSSRDWRFDGRNTKLCCSGNGADATQYFNRRESEPVRERDSPWKIYRLDENFPIRLTTCLANRSRKTNPENFLSSSSSMNSGKCWKTFPFANLIWYSRTLPLLILLGGIKQEEAKTGKSICFAIGCRWGDKSPSIVEIFKEVVGSNKASSSCYILDQPPPSDDKS